MYRPETMTQPHRTNISYYLETDDILDLLFRKNTSSFKLAEETDRIETHKNAKEEGIVNWISGKKQKLVKLSEDEKLNPGKTIMVFESYKEINKFLASDFSVKTKRYDITKYGYYVLIHNDKSNMLLYSLEDFNKIIGKISEENLTIIFDNTYQYYIKSIMKNEDLYPLICDEKENIKFFFLDNLIID
jgi:hypothetical protein